MLDGICHPRWSVWLNWMLTRESYDSCWTIVPVWCMAAVSLRLVSRLESTKAFVLVEFKSACPEYRRLTPYNTRRLRGWDPGTGTPERGIASKFKGKCQIECFPHVCTHRPSHWASTEFSEVVTRCPGWKVWMDSDWFSGGRFKIGNGPGPSSFWKFAVVYYYWIY